MKVFNNVADLKLARLAIDQIVKTKGYYTPNDGGGGEYIIVTADTGTDDGGSYIDLALNRAELISDGTVNIKQYGLVADGTAGAATGTDNSTAWNALISNTNIKFIEGAEGTYYFGTLGLDEALSTRQNVPIHIDWKGAYLTISGDNTIVNTGMVFLKLLDINGSMINFEFEDVGYNIATSTGRGVAPIIISNVSANTEGYVFGNYIVHKGQSLLTAFSFNPTTARAKNIRFEGYVHGEDSYYGVNLANNGDDFSGKYTIKNFFRALFAYGTDGLNAEYTAENGQATSSALLISSTGSTANPTQNYNIIGRYLSLNGNMSILGQSTDDTGVYKNINLDLYVKALNTNKTTATAFTIGAGGSTSSTYTVDGIEFNLYTDVEFVSAVTINADSPNFGSIKVTSNRTRAMAGPTNNFDSIDVSSQSKMVYVGDLTAGSVFVPSGSLAQGQSTTSLFSCKLLVSLYNDFTFSGQRLSYAEYFVSGYISSGGDPTLTNTTVLHRVDVGTSPHPVVTIANSAGGITVAGDTFTDANSRISVISEPLRF